MEKILIQINNLSYRYPGHTRSVLDKICFEIRTGERTALLGANGSGKSTLLNCINGLLVPFVEDTLPPPVIVYDTDGSPLHSTDVHSLEKIRRRLATVLQNPDDQIISSVVEEDTAFGPENLGLPEDEVRERVDAALRYCGLEKLKKRQTRFLSGGERQRLTLAGVLALGTEIIALDEAVSMLDPLGREAFLALLDKLSAEGKTILQVTHSMEEASRCSRCLALYRGCLVFDGSPEELFKRPEEAETWGLVLPELYKANRLLRASFPGNECNKIDCLRGVHTPSLQGGVVESSLQNVEPAVSFFNVSHIYPETGYTGMNNVSFELADNKVGQLIALIGQSGSGKSTVLKHINALLLPTEGQIRVLGKDTMDRNVRLSDLRMNAALSVQNPESALFERYVADDIAFGPKNGGLSGAELVRRVETAMEITGLPFNEFADRETRSLSGGEKRLAAIAGTAAMESEILLLDEPLAGLDSFHQQKVLDLIESFRRAGKTVIISTHSMETAVLADKVGIMTEGKLAAFAAPREIFGPLWDTSWGLSLPRIAITTVRRITVTEEGNPFTDVFGGEPSSAIELAPIEVGGDSGTRELVKTVLQPVSRPKKVRRKTGMEFFRMVSFGEFLDRPSALRNLGGGVKLALLFALAITVLACPVPFVQMGVLIFSIAAGWFAGSIGPVHLFRGFFRILPWLLFLAAIQLVFRLGDLDFIRPLGLILRVAAVSVLISLFSAVTPLQEMLGALNRFLSLPGRFGFPVRDIALAAGIALRFTPVLMEEAERIVSAQLSRGGKKGRIRMVLSLIVPLFLRSLERSETLAKAMMLRCYRR